MRYLMFLLTLMFTNVANAIDCQTPPDCAELGYSKDNDPNCTDDGYMYCPFNHDYKKCVNHDCAKLGFTTSDKTSWCGKIVKCEGNEDYTLCAKLPSCEIGDVFYADGSCGKADAYSQGSSPKPVGVIYWLTEDGKHGKVINLRDLAASNGKFDPTNPYKGGREFEWGDLGPISGLTNWTCSGNSNYLTVAATGNHEDPFWSAGESYTDIIAKHTYAGEYSEMARAVQAFYPYPDLKSDPLVGAGKWYLPTIGELMDLYGYNYSNLGTCHGSTGATGETLQAVEDTLETLRDKDVDARTFDTEYWSSSQYDIERSWMINMYTGKRNYIAKNQYFAIRASLQF